MSAFSCGPGAGSEAGVGWNIALETARLGHEVLVLTQTQFQVEIERELAAGTLPANLRFDIFTPGWLEWVRETGLRWGFPLTWYLVSVLWQVCALFHARGRYNQADFDLIHHVSFASIRHPTLLTRLGLPTVIGPIGGGESAPLALRKTFPFRYWCGELLRDAHNWALRADPITRLAFRDAKLIILRTKESLVAVPRHYRNKVVINVGLGIAETIDNKHKPVPRKSEDSFRLLYAGRLMWWKGVHLALRALAKARAQNVDATLTIVGEGPARRDLERLARQLGIYDSIIWRGEIPRQELLGMYGGYHAFLFPSLHDAGGMVILEAWVHGLPVICLDLGGPGEIVDPTCGCVVPVANCSENECVTRIASEIIALAANEPRRLELCHGTIKRCRALSWSKIVTALYTEIDNRLQRSGLEHNRFVEHGSAGGHFPDRSMSSL